MRAISLKLSENVLETSCRCADTLNLSRVAYIRRAIERMNRHRGNSESKTAGGGIEERAQENMRVNHDFAAIG